MNAHLVLSSSPPVLSSSLLASVEVVSVTVSGCQIITVFGFEGKSILCVSWCIIDIVDELWFSVKYFAVI